MPRRYVPKPESLVDVPPEPTETELDAIAAQRPPPTPVELRSLERSVRILGLPRDGSRARLLGEKGLCLFEEAADALLEEPRL